MILSPLTKRFCIWWTVTVVLSALAVATGMGGLARKTKFNSMRGTEYNRGQAGKGMGVLSPVGFSTWHGIGSPAATGIHDDVLRRQRTRYPLDYIVYFKILYFSYIFASLRWHLLFGRIKVS